MTFDQQTEGNTEVLTLSEPSSPLAVTILALAVMVMVAMALVLVVKSVPYFLIALMLVAVVMVGQLAHLTAQSLWGTVVRMDAEGLTIARLFSTIAYPWQEVADVRLCHSGGTINDNPRSEDEERFAVGLFLKGGLAGSVTDREPDIIVCCGSSEFTNQLSRLVETIKRQAVRHTNKASAQKSRAVVANGEFRRRAAGGSLPSPVGGTTSFAPATKSPFGRRPD